MDFYAEDRGIGGVPVFTEEIGNGGQKTTGCRKNSWVTIPKRWANRVLVQKQSERMGLKMFLDHHKVARTPFNDNLFRWLHAARKSREKLGNSRFSRTGRNVTTMVKQCFTSGTCAAGNPTTTYTYDETGEPAACTPNESVRAAILIVHGLIGVSTSLPFFNQDHTIRNRDGLGAMCNHHPGHFERRKSSRNELLGFQIQMAGGLIEN